MVVRVALQTRSAFFRHFGFCSLKKIDKYLKHPDAYFCHQKCFKHTHHAAAQTCFCWYAMFLAGWVGGCLARLLSCTNLAFSRDT